MCLALDLGDQTIRIPESPEREQSEAAWNDLQAKGSLSDQTRFWLQYRKSNRLSERDTLIAFVSHLLFYCLIYN